jgi:hypothetical protein
LVGDPAFDGTSLAINLLGWVSEVLTWHELSDHGHPGAQTLSRPESEGDATTSDELRPYHHIMDSNRLKTMARKVSKLFLKKSSTSSSLDSNTTPRIDGSEDKKASAFLNKSSSSKAATEKDKKLAAFRTITAMLALIQQDRPLQLCSEDPTEKEESELKIYSAISTLAVTDHEVVAVMANPAPPTLQLIVCQGQSSKSDGGQPISIQPSSSLPRGRRVWEVLATQNPRHDLPGAKKDDTEDSWIIPEGPVCLRPFQHSHNRFQDANYLALFRNHLNAQSR